MDPFGIDLLCLGVGLLDNAPDCVHRRRRLMEADPHHSYSAPTPTEAPPVASMAPFAFNCCKS